MSKNLILPMGVAGYFKFEAVNVSTGKRRLLLDWFKNRILDQGLNRLGTEPFMDYCQVGSGSTAPADNNTGLQSLVATTTGVQSNTQGSAASAPYYGWFRRTYRFAAGVAAGNLSEVGVGWGASNQLFSRSLIRDAEGNPTTITILSDEFLDVTYEFRLYAPTSDSTFTLTIAGVEYTFTMRAAAANSSAWIPSGAINAGMNNVSFGGDAFQGPMGTDAQYPSGTSAVGAASKAAYSNNSLQRTGVITFALNNGNLSGGIGVVLFSTGGSMGVFQFGVTPKIPKTASTVLTLNYALSWARYTG